MLLIHLGFALNAAIFQAGAIYPQAKILKMAITAASDTSNYDSIPPCGACRQSQSMKQSKIPIQIYFMGEIRRHL
jgi:cytidine deaminase